MVLLVNRLYMIFNKLKSKFVIINLIWSQITKVMKITIIQHQKTKLTLNSLKIIFRRRSETYQFQFYQSLPTKKKKSQILMIQINMRKPQMMVNMLKIILALVKSKKDRKIKQVMLLQILWLEKKICIQVMMIVMVVVGKIYQLEKLFKMMMI